MAFEMLDDLALRFGDESQASAIAREPREGTDRERARVPDRIQYAQPTIELADSFCTPSEMIRLLARRFHQRFPGRRRSGHEGLALIQGLSGHFAGVIDAHERCRVLSILLALHGIRNALGRVGAGGVMVGQQGPNRLIERDQEAITRSQGPRRRGCRRSAHGSTLYMCRVDRPLRPEWAPDRAACPSKTARFRGTAGLQSPRSSFRLAGLLAPRLKKFPENSMRTVFANAATVRRDWYVVDATNKTLARLASQVASRLRGKHKASFTTNADAGDHIVIINAGKIRVTGRKLTDKFYHRHTGYIGNLKSTSLEKLLEKHPERAIEYA